jgi:hypothetical protein
MECTQLWYPKYTTTAQNGIPGGTYHLPWDLPHFRKYNILVGGLKIRQRRGTFEQCNARHFLEKFSVNGDRGGFDETGPAPAFKCYTRNYKKVRNMLWRLFFGITFKARLQTAGKNERRVGAL